MGQVNIAQFSTQTQATAFTAPSPGTIRRITLIGSTGSIGTQGLEVIASAPDRFAVAALSGGHNLALLATQAVATGAPAVGCAHPDIDALSAAIAKAAKAAGVHGYSPQLFAGEHAATEIARFPDADVVLNGITGSIGLAPTLAALKAGHLLALANKESLIVGGQLVKAAAAPGQLVPVDSEHSALAQALRSGTPDEVHKLIVTASGGPFRGWSAEALREVTPTQALAHPTWAMGKVITTNSATMVNKALEVIEAHLLFDVPLERIEAVVHPQSIVHSMVEFIDGSTIAQASPPDMALPIALGIGWPHRVPGSATACDWSAAASWTFEPLDEEAFGAIRLAKAAAAASPTHMAVYNAVNEEAVEAFHAGAIRFTDIVETIEAILQTYTPESGEPTLQTVLAAETWARKAAAKRLESL